MIPIKKLKVGMKVRLTKSCIQDLIRFAIDEVKSFIPKNGIITVSKIGVTTFSFRELRGYELESVDIEPVKKVKFNKKSMIL